MKKNGNIFAILSLCTENYQALANLTWPNKVEYARQYKYNFLCKNNDFTLKHASGEKLLFIKKYLTENPNTQWVWWLDIDTLITNFHIKIEDRIDDNYDFIITKDINGINAGSFFIKNSPAGNELLDWMIDVYPIFEKQTGFFAEQTAMEAAMHIEKFKKITKFVSQKSINSYHDSLNPVYNILSNQWVRLGPDAIWERGDFVVHFPGTTMEQRLTQLVPHYYRTGIIKKLLEFTHEDRYSLVYEISKRTDGRVVQGPFTGMKILNQAKWGDGDIGGKLLGTYESELFPSIEKSIKMNPDVVVNVGCAEGYFGIGIGMRTNARTILVDIEADVLKNAEDNALANSFTNFELSTESSKESLKKFLQKGLNPFLFMDCEGYEFDLLSIDDVPELKNTIIIVESHDCFRPGLTEILKERFVSTHNVEIISQGNKNPYHPIIADFDDAKKLLLTCEFRPSTMNWLFMTPKKNGYV